MNLKQQLTDYLEFVGDMEVPPLGEHRGKRRDFGEGLAQVRRRSRVGFWTVAVVLVVVLGLQMTAGIHGILDPEGVRVAFGAGAGGLAVLLVRLFREQVRADFVLTAMHEVWRVDEARFIALVTELARKWYGIGKAAHDPKAPATVVPALPSNPTT